ncbi:GNAT superfamily N-acetyltransferase [Planomicrobium stackebrandtii]|uniref:GNAT superfamily N-acetyltransferase n=1 Tax=Planomicrobium stackebrandtii TaxID=253160 RepID=A0ABU0GRD6_9BACL|nr:GNAT family N-acetyltransferase [Planomicrobium stackebrandtii]MDQ0427180.1 GNAT superfamily N-acetyltransferase [Planomicrobium stackebrandtii]
MILKLEPLTKKQHNFGKVKELYYGSFPKNEQIPMNLLLWKAKQDFVDFLALYDEGQFVGFTYLITHKDLTYVLYIAIDSNARSNGYGGQALAEIKEKYPYNRIILNIEVVDEAANNHEQRVTRRKFYTRNGYKGSTYLYQDRWSVYEVMVHGGKVSADEFHALLKIYAGALLFSVFKPKITSSTAG